MNENIRSLLHLLRSNTVAHSKMEEAFATFVSLTTDTDTVSENREDVSRLFFSLLCSCGQIYGEDIKKSRDGLPTSIKKYVFTSFQNIERIYVEATSEENDSSCIVLIRFLSELKTKGATKHAASIERDFLESHVQLLLDVLSDVSFLFDMKIDGDVVFPINTLIANVIGNKDFINGGRKLKENDIKLLQLAVRLFQTSEEEETLRKLVDDCNLRFIRYLGYHGQILDTDDFLNYQSNGTMIFHDDSANKILIRNEDKRYFEGDTAHKYEVCAERDHEGKDFCWFIEYDLGEYNLTTYTEVISKPDKAGTFLELLYDQGYRNVFMEGVIASNERGDLISVNPYSFNDEYAIKGSHNEAGAKTLISEGVTDFIGKYRLCTVREDKLNILTFGLCSRLLEINNIGVNRLKINDLARNRWYQEQVIENWATDSTVDEADLQEMLIQWCNQLEYCSKITSFEKHNLCQQDFLPLQQSLDSFYNIIVSERATGELVLKGLPSINDDESGYDVQVAMKDTYYGRHLRSTGKKSLEIAESELDDITDGIDWEKKIGTPVYFTFSLEQRKGHIANQTILKAIAGLETIMQRTMPQDVGIAVTQHNIDVALAAMKMYESGFNSYARRSKEFTVEQFKMQAIQRLLHNMIWSGITTENKAEYFEIIQRHQLVGFEQIGDDNIFQRLDPNTLYLAKDSAKKRSVLTDIYYSYISPADYRDKHPLYYGNITKVEKGKYRINGENIEKIVLLTDNFVYGKSTIAAIVAYMGIKNDDIKGYELSDRRVKEAVRSCQDLTCNGKPITLLDICKTNGDIPVHVHGYYGTDEGAAIIKAFLDENWISEGEVTYTKEINSKANDTPYIAYNIWGGKVNKPEKKNAKHIFFREISMPKYTVFPDQMLCKEAGDINKAICMFVKREEL